MNKQELTKLFAVREGLRYYSHQMNDILALHPENDDVMNVCNMISDTYALIGKLLPMRVIPAEQMNQIDQELKALEAEAERIRQLKQL
jgi:hypothetical protein